MPAINGYLLGRGFDALNDGDTTRRVPLRDRCSAVVEVTPHGGDPLRRDHVDEGVGAHADDPARQPARRSDGERWPGGRAAGRFGGRGASRTSATTPRTSPNWSTASSTSPGGWSSASPPASSSGWPTPALRPSSYPARRCRARHQGRRHPDQGVPGRRPRGHRRGDRAGRRHDGGRDDGQGQRRCRQHAGEAQGPRRPPRRHGGTRSGAQRGRVRVQPGGRRRRLRIDLHRQCRRDRVGQLHRRDARTVCGLRRVAQLPAQDDRAGAGPPQAGRRRVRPDADARRRSGRREHRAAA